MALDGGLGGSRESGAEDSSEDGEVDAPRGVTGMGWVGDVSDNGVSTCEDASSHGGGRAHRLPGGQEAAAAAEIRALSLLPLVDLAATAFRALAGPTAPLPALPSPPPAPAPAPKALPPARGRQPARAGGEGANRGGVRRGATGGEAAAQEPSASSQTVDDRSEGVVSSQSSRADTVVESLLAASAASASGILPLALAKRSPPRGRAGSRAPSRGASSQIEHTVPAPAAVGAPPGISTGRSARELRATGRAARQDGTLPRASSPPASAPAPAAATRALPTGDMFDFHVDENSSAAPRTRVGRGSTSTPSPASRQSPLCRHPQHSPNPLAARAEAVAVDAAADGAAPAPAGEAPTRQRQSAPVKSDGGRLPAPVRAQDPFAFDEVFGGVAAGVVGARGGLRNVVSFARKNPGCGAPAARNGSLPTSAAGSASASPGRAAPPAAERPPGSVACSSLQDPSAAGPLSPYAQPQPSPPPVRATVAAQEVRARLEHERSHRGILLLALKVLVNLTNSQQAACEELLRAPRALPLVASILASEFAGADRRGGLPRHFDTALMCLGLLTNIVEVRPDAQAAVGGTPCLADASPPRACTMATALKATGSMQAPPPIALLDLLSTVLRSLLQPLPREPQPLPSADGAPGRGTAGLALSSTRASSPCLPASRASSPAAPAGGATPTTRHMEREVAGAYTALLLGFLCRGCVPHCTRVLATLGSDSFAPVSQLLVSFLELHDAAGLLSPEGTKAMASVVEWMGAYGTGAPARQAVDANLVVGGAAAVPLPMQASAGASV